MNTVTIDIQLYDKLKESYDVIAKVRDGGFVALTYSDGFIIMKDENAVIRYLSENSILLNQRVKQLETELFKIKFKKSWF